MKPLILINTKTYSQAQAKNGIKLVQKIASVRSQKYTIAVAPTLPNLSKTKETVSIPIYAQHTDAIESGAHTGSICIDELKALNVAGIILNHSEKQLPLSTLRATLTLAKKKHLPVIICVRSLTQIKQVTTLKPEYIAYEPPQFIGSEISVTTAQPKILKTAHDYVKKHSPKTLLLCGAGVHSHQDIITAVKLGYSGVLLSHAIVTAAHPDKALKQLLK